MCICVPLRLGGIPSTEISPFGNSKKLWMGRSACGLCLVNHGKPVGTIFHLSSRISRKECVVILCAKMGLYMCLCAWNCPKACYASELLQSKSISRNAQRSRIFDNLQPVQLCPLWRLDAIKKATCLKCVDDIHILQYMLVGVSRMEFEIWTWALVAIMCFLYSICVWEK